MTALDTAVDSACAALDRIAEADRPEAWIHVRDRVAIIAEAASVDARREAGETLPLAGRTLAVKDNIDVAGLPTTAGCPAYSYTPERDAAAVARLRAGGAIVLGKTNLDQFATGLVGTRSPYGAVRDVGRPEYVAGGSSSGSAVAVALGCADLALSTDTAGSGRVPAAFQGIVGVKPTRGLVPVSGVVPACRSFDCVGLLARTLGEAGTALAVLAAEGPDPGDPLGRAWPAGAPLAAPPAPRVAVAAAAGLTPLSAGARAAYGAAVELLAATGAEIEELDLGPFLEAGGLLYGGAFVAERFAAVGAFIVEHPGECDPVVREIVLAAGQVRAADYVRDTARLDALRARCQAALAPYDALLLPTAPAQPTIEEVQGDPIEVNRRLGVYTTFANLLDLCAVAVPAGEADGGHFGVSLLAPAFHDRVLVDLGARLTGEEPDAGELGEAVPLLVVGAHLTGMPLNPQLTRRGARRLGDARTVPRYGLFALDTEPPKPGLVRVAGEGGVITGEVWAMPPEGLASFLAELPSPMALGRVELEDGREVVGFLCEPVALEGAEEITRYGSWREYLRER